MYFVVFSFVIGAIVLAGIGIWHILVIPYPVVVVIIVGPDVATVVVIHNTRGIWNPAIGCGAFLLSMRAC